MFNRLAFDQEAESCDGQMGMPRIKRITIMPGDHGVSWEPVEFVTILGSCIAACIWDDHLKIGGMNHFMLPDVPVGSTGLSDKTKPLRYGVYAMEQLVNDLLLIGARRSRLKAKVFGGANVTSVLNGHSIGQRNAEFVVRFLQQDGIQLVGKDLLGEHSRHIVFNTRSGAVLMRKSVSRDAVVEKEERRYQQQVNKDPVVSDITFFNE